MTTLNAKITTPNSKNAITIILNLDNTLNDVIVTYKDEEWSYSSMISLANAIERSYKNA